MNNKHTALRGLLWFICVYHVVLGLCANLPPSQVQAIAAALLGAAQPALEAPWFWSDQFDLKLQTAGLWTGADQTIMRGDPATRAFAVFYLKEGRVIAVDAVNSGPEFIVGKKLVAAKAAVAPGDLADKSISMKDIGARALG